MSEIRNLFVPPIIMVCLGTLPSPVVVAPWEVQFMGIVIEHK